MSGLSIVLENGELRLVAPSGHHLRVPNEQSMGALARQVLEAQVEAELRGRLQGIGTWSSPTQSMVDKWLLAGGAIKVIKKAPTAAEREAAAKDVTLEDLGL